MSNKQRYVLEIKGRGTMKRFAAILLASMTMARAQRVPKPVFAAEPLNAVQISIYRDFLRSYNNGSSAKLLIANETEKFEPDQAGPGSCVSAAGILEKRSLKVHYFSASAFQGLPVQLVDPKLHQEHDPGDAIKRGEDVEAAVTAGFAAALFTFSEIAFNKSQTRAAFTYSFYCGRLCGNGGTILYELKEGRWQRDTKTRCSTWVS